jgi:fumarylpyruvate hydrolase
MDYVIAPPNVTSLPIVGSDRRFPVRRVYCVGRNYAEHALEMGYDPVNEPPFFFQKNPDNLVTGGADFPYPDKSLDVHFEIELVVALGGGGKNISSADAHKCIWGYAVGLDMTRRDRQVEMKNMGKPWETGKAFDHSAPCSDLVPIGQTGLLERGEIWLNVNGERRQQGDLGQMIWRVASTISYLSGLFELAPGDVIFTGTPAGVGPTKRGDILHGHVDGVGDLHCKVV